MDANSNINRIANKVVCDGGKSLFAIEANGETKKLSIKPLDDLYVHNVTNFVCQIRSRNDLIGICDGIESALKFIDNIELHQTLHRDVKLLCSEKLFVLEGEPTRQGVRVDTLNNILRSNGIAYANSFTRGWLTMGIFIEEETARMQAELITSYLQHNRVWK